MAGVTVVLPAGGRGERLAALAAKANVNKVALKAGKFTLIERTLAMYARAGVKRFVVLTGHQALSVRSTLGDGRRWRVSITYAQDPPVPVGKGGAIRLALDRGVIPAEAPFIVHNPDDQVVRIDRRFPALVWNRHRALARRGAIVTAVCVPDTDYPYSAFTARANGMASAAVMYPKVSLPTHIGVTVVDPAAIPVFHRLIDLDRKTDFESVVLPWLAKRSQLGLAMLPSGSWIPVNDLKGYKALLAAI
jgi:NDP-sugar pyrophosphorylase family protein